MYVDDIGQATRPGPGPSSGAAGCPHGAAHPTTVYPQARTERRAPVKNDEAETHVIGIKDEQQFKRHLGSLITD